MWIWKKMRWVCVLYLIWVEIGAYFYDFEVYGGWEEIKQGWDLSKKRKEFFFYIHTAALQVRCTCPGHSAGAPLARVCCAWRGCAKPTARLLHSWRATGRLARVPRVWRTCPIRPVDLTLKKFSNSIFFY